MSLDEIYRRCRWGINCYEFKDTLKSSVSHHKNTNGIAIQIYTLL